jgi:quercetin dioxygenase-like cupin family protein
MGRVLEWNAQQHGIRDDTNFREGFMRYSLTRALGRCVFFCAVALVSSIPLFSETREVLMDNAKVRVLRVTVHPGEATEIDNPKLDRVVVWLQEGRGHTLSPAGKAESISWKQNEAKWEPADSARSMRLNAKDSVAAIVVELKGKGDAQKAPASPQNPWIVDPKHYKIEFENRNVRVSRVKIGPKESTPLHEHSLNRVVVYLTPLDFQIDPEGKPSEHSVQKAGAVAWGTPVRHTEHNLSDEEFEGVVIEPKY